MAEWRKRTLGSLCEAGVAELQTGPFGSQLHAHDYVPDGVAVVPTEAIRGRRIDHSVLPKISPIKALELKRHRLQQGDILFARRGVQATGHIGCVRKAEAGFICGTGAIRLRVDQGAAIIDADFLSHVLSDPAATQWFKFHAIGATMPNLNESIVRTFSLLVPPLDEQRAIAHILGTLDDKIELNRRMNETLEAMARALFKSWFVDFEPVRAKAEGRDPGLPRHLADLFPDSFEDSELGEIPQGWEIRQIGAVADVVGGSTPSTKEPSYWQGGSVHWVTPKDLSNHVTPPLLSTERRITELGLAQISSGLLPIGTVLLSSRAPIGYLAISEVPVAINQGFIAMIPKDGVSNLFLYFWAQFSNDSILGRANGSTFLEISKSSFRPIPLIWSNLAMMNTFEERVRSAYQRILENVRETATLANLRDTLLPKLISGELRVKDAEKFIAKAL